MLTNRRTKLLFGYSPISALRRSGAFFLYTVVIMVAVGNIGLQRLVRIAKVHFKVDHVVMDHNLFNKGVY